MAPSRLIGRAAVLQEVKEHLAARRSVLLVGPAGSGKTAIIKEIRPAEGVLVVDPFARITTPRAAALRRALDRGATVLGAARSVNPSEMGHVGRVSWRLNRVYLRPLPPRDIRRILRGTLAAQVGPELPLARQWISEAVDTAEGLPGRAVALASVVAARWRKCGTLLLPRFALAIAWQDAMGQSGNYLNHAGDEPGESS